MSVDIERMRQWARSSGPLNIEFKVGELCDEIDRLREQIKGMSQDAAEWAIRIAPERNELLRLREQLRPRSIKDEPPPDGKPFLRLGTDDCWYATRDTHGSKESGFRHWLPMPPAPPQPDAFEEWAEAQPWWQEFGDLSRAYVKEAWNAAKQSTKSHEKTNPVD